jgi:cell division protein FtsL
MPNTQNAAYDLALFESKKTKLVALKPNKKEQKVNSRRQKAQAILNVSAYVLIAAVVLGMIGMMITSNAQLTELNSKIAESKAHLSELQSESVRLESELAGKTSIANINNYARENGMTVADSNQICYISVDGSDTVTVASGSGGWFAGIWRSLQEIFS